MSGPVDRAAGSALVVFLKYPRPGLVKTRLVPTLGAESAAELYRVLAEEVLRATIAPKGEYETLVFFDPPEEAEAMRAWLPGVRLRAQSGGDLGARMSAAFTQAFERGASRVAIIGTDAPGVTSGVVVEALAALDRAEVVVGPADDGGYYLLALKEPRPELFRGIAWSTATVLEDTLRLAADEELGVHQRPPLRDVDTPEDLRAEWPRVRPLLSGHPGLRERLEDVLALP